MEPKLTKFYQSSRSLVMSNPIGNGLTFIPVANNDLCLQSGYRRVCCLLPIGNGLKIKKWNLRTSRWYSQRRTICGNGSSNWQLERWHNSSNWRLTNKHTVGIWIDLDRCDHTAMQTKKEKHLQHTKFSVAYCWLWHWATQPNFRANLIFEWIIVPALVYAHVGLSAH